MTIDKQRIEDAVETIVSASHGESVRAGWWTDLRTGSALDINSKFGEKIALIHSEISEALEGHRKNLRDDHLPEFRSVEVELADAIIRIGDLAGAMKLRLGAALVAKMVYNRVRADHKPEARLALGGKAF